MIGFICISHLAKTQNQKFADSLKEVYQTEDLSYEETFNVLRGIAEESTYPNEAIKYSRILINLASRDSNDLWLHRGFMQEGNALRRRGDLDESIKSYFLSLEAAERIEYEAGIGGALATIGGTYSNNGDHRNAINYHNRAIKILRIANDSVTLASSLLNTGYEYYLVTKYDSSLVYYKEAESIFLAKEFPLGIAYTLGNTGLALAKLGKTDSAEVIIQEAISMLLGFNDTYAITEYQIEIADVFLNRNQLGIAEKYALGAYKLAKKDGLKKRVRDASLKLSELYQTTGDYQRAYTYQSQYIAYRDSINNEETIRKMADLRTEYEVGQKQAEVDLAKAEKEAQRLQSLIIGAGLVIILIFIAVIAFIQYRNNLLKKATNRVLSLQKTELEKQKIQLEALNNTKDRFFSIISHDLRGPVNAFFGVSKLIKMYVSRGKVNEISELAEDIDESVSKLSGLLDSLLDWAVQQQGQFPNVPEKVNFNEMATDLVQIFDNMARSKHIHLSADLPEKVELFVDKNSTMTIFRNLINNALKFTEENGSVTLLAEVSGEYATLKVTDTGVGIPKDKLSKLFNLSEKKSTWGTAGEKGLGLGLQLAFEFAEMNKGAIEVESEEGVGTTFSVKLPLFEKQLVKPQS